ncbi:response regulator [Chryseolinea lacunae]|uniref:Response regulator n=1 Tax=Chryseolinea lacunae TaxID=2801331 RepID=A0ABS1KXR3_9BACT|nr:response regulator [Chryseolinea lacunae]MBL0744169.1 response regulator [Chryseolinea lacunae]
MFAVDNEAAPMQKENIVLIANSNTTLDWLEDILHDVCPTVQCISFIYADEALEMIQHEFKHMPTCIFLDADLKRLSGTRCLQTLRENRALDACFIGVLSSMMPSVVADTYLRMGANAAFQQPLTTSEGKEIFSSLLHRHPNIECATLKNAHTIEHTPTLVTHGHK